MKNSNTNTSGTMEILVGLKPNSSGATINRDITRGTVVMFQVKVFGT